MASKHIRFGAFGVLASFFGLALVKIVSCVDDYWRMCLRRLRVSTVIQGKIENNFITLLGLEVAIIDVHKDVVARILLRSLCTMHPAVGSPEPLHNALILFLAQRH